MWTAKKPNKKKAIQQPSVPRPQNVADGFAESLFRKHLFPECPKADVAPPENSRVR
jgi:hypothetical protein